MRMIGRLIKFLLVTRFSKPLLIMIFGLLAYSILLGTLSKDVRSPVSSFFTYYVIGVLVLLMVFMVYMGGVAIMKSDLDYLFTLPLSRRDLSICLYTVQFIATGISFLFAVGYILPLVGNEVSSVYMAVAGILLLALAVTSLSVISYRLGSGSKAALSAFIGAWAVLPLLGVNYSFTSLFTGNVGVAVLELVLLNIPLSIVAARELRTAEIGLLRNVARGSVSFRRTEQFTGASPILAIYRKNLHEVNLTGRIGIGGSMRVRVSRVSIYTVVLAAVPIAGLYGYIAMTVGAHAISIPVLLATLYTGIFVPILFSQDVLAHERAWLSFTSMPPQQYWRHLSAAKMVQCFLLTLPFAAVDMVLYLHGQLEAAGAMIFISSTVPFFTCVVIYMNARLAAMQILDTDFMAGQQGLRQVGALFPVLLLAIMSILSVLSIVFAVGLAILAAIISFYLTASRRTAQRLVSVLTERGFV
ncbi:MAG: hypothetical protein QXP70_03310 [Methanomassiliicoccales archaeon]